MSSKISFRLENNILMCFVTGQRSNQDVEPFWNELVSECRENRIKHVQLTMAMRGKLNPFDAIKKYQKIIEILTPIDLKLTITDLNHLSAADTQVACNMGVSRGIDVAYFESESEAKNWLKQSKQSLQIDSSEFNKIA